jgi:hypothetical protein
LQGVKLETYYIGEVRKDAAGSSASHVLAATRLQASDDDDTLLESYADLAASDVAESLPNSSMVKAPLGCLTAQGAEGGDGEVSYMYTVSVPPTFDSRCENAIGELVGKAVRQHVLYQWYAHRDDSISKSCFAEYERLCQRICYDICRRVRPILHP